MLMAISDHQGIIGTLLTPYLWRTVKVLFHESACRSFGHYEQITPNQNTTLPHI
jgi:hypothetical protein